MKFHLDYMPINWNEYINKERSSYYLANKIKQEEKQIVKYLCRKKYEGNYPIEITFTIHYKDCRQDLDNFRMKGLIDGLVANGIIENDNLKKIQKITLIPVFEGDGVDIEIKEVYGS